MSFKSVFMRLIMRKYVKFIIWENFFEDILLEVFVGFGLKLNIWDCEMNVVWC